MFLNGGPRVIIYYSNVNYLQVVEIMQTPLIHYITLNLFYLNTGLDLRGLIGMQLKNPTIIQLCNAQWINGMKKK